MKFNKTLRNYTKKYAYCVSPQYWFDYKSMKKYLKKIKIDYGDIIQTHFDSSTETECCICLEGTQLMQMFCCKQYIHHKCIIHLSTSCGFSCPMCRANIHEYISIKLETRQQKLDAAILSLLSRIHLDIIKIENVYNRRLIINLITLQKYCHINYTAIIKICKKIKKSLHIDILNYFIDVLNKNGIIKPCESQHHSCVLS
jgi:hypothetical protein